MIIPLSLDNETSSALQKIDGYTNLFSESTTGIIKTLVAVILAIALFFVIDQIANNKPKAKEYAIAWLIGLILFLIILQN